MFHNFINPNVVTAGDFTYWYPHNFLVLREYCNTDHLSTEDNPPLASIYFGQKVTDVMALFSKQQIEMIC